MWFITIFIILESKSKTCFKYQNNDIIICHVVSGNSIAHSRENKSEKGNTSLILF